MSNSSTSGGVVAKSAVETLKLALKAKSGITQPERIKPRERKKALSKEEIKDMIGLYAVETIGLFDVSEKKWLPAC